MNEAKKGGDLTPAVFLYGATKEVRTLVHDNQPWFVAKDVCGVLGLSHLREAVRNLDEDETRVSVVLTPLGGPQKMQLVNESGLYNLIFRSRKAEAKAFRRWVTGTVLPSIRRTGGFGAKKKVASLPKYEDVRHVPYATVQLRGIAVRRIAWADANWYSLNDVLSSLGTRTSAHQSAKVLPAEHRRVLWIFGCTQAGWFTDELGVRLLFSARGFSQLTLS